MKFGVKKEGGALIGGGALNGEFTVGAAISMSTGWPFKYYTVKF